MNNLKIIALLGVAATSVNAHRRHGHGDNHLRDLLNQKEEFLASCSVEVPMCEDIIAKENAKVIVDPTNGEDSDSGATPADIVHQCVADSLAACLPALESKDPSTITHCVLENRQEIIEKFRDLSPECQEAFRDLLHHRRRRHDHDHDEDHDRDRDHDEDQDHDHDHDHDHGEDHDDDDDDSDSHMHLSASGADIGSCLLSNTQNLTAPCLSAVESVDVSKADAWAFLDAEPQQDEHHRRFLRWIGSLVFLSLVCCCCVRAYKRRQRRDSGSPACQRRCRGAPITNIGSVQTANPATDAQQDPELARAIAASLADSGRTGAVSPTAPPASYQPPRPVDVAYTGASNREAFLAPGTIHSDQYV